MGLRSDIAAAVQSAMVALGDIKLTATYTKVTTGSTYNPSTGTTDETTTEYSLEGVQYSYAEENIDGVQVKRGDSKFLFESRLLDFDPSDNDFITIAARRWEIVKPSKDPADATWILQLRGD